MEQSTQKPGGDNQVTKRPNLRHGIWTFLNRNEIPAEFEHVAVMAEEFRNGLLSDEGMLAPGPEGPNHKRLAILDGAVRSYIVVQLAIEHLLKTGFVVRSKKDQPMPNACLKLLGHFENILRLNLLSLGLERRSRRVEVLESYIAEHYPQGHEAQEKGDSTANPSEEGWGQA